MTENVTLLSCDENVTEVRRVTLVGFLVNVVLSALKFAAGIVGNSQALVADAVHSLSDIVTDIALLVGVGLWSKPPDECHPHGHWRIEFLVTISIGLLLAVVAIGLAYRALSLGPTGADPPGRIAFFAAVVSIVSKELLYRWTDSAGRRIRSSALLANAWHHRSDGLSSIPVALAVAGAALVPGLWWLDRVGAILVSAFILYAAWNIVHPALEKLIDRGAPKPILQDIERLVADTQGVEEVHALRTRHIGSGLQVDLHILVDPDMTVREGHDISEEVKKRLVAQVVDVVDVMVHLEPYEVDTENYIFDK